MAGYNFLQFGEGEPVASCLSNHEAEEFMKLYFSYLAGALGSVIPIWLMSDMAPQVYKAFCTLFRRRPRWLWCTWHVDKSWKEDPNIIIKDKELETMIYLQL